MTKGFMLVPDSQIFDTCFLANSEGDSENPCLLLFKEAWNYKIDNRRKVIKISGQLDKELVAKNYKSDKKKRLALLSCVSINGQYDIDEETSDFCQLRLAIIMAIDLEEDVYYVTDNNKIREIVNKKTQVKAISSEDALKLFKE